MAGELKSAHSWAAEKGDTIMDPDGWRHRFRHIEKAGEEPVDYKPRPMEDLITEHEYRLRLGMSTVSLKVRREGVTDPRVQHHPTVLNQIRDITPDDAKWRSFEVTGKILVACGCGFDSGWVDRSEWPKKKLQEFYREHTPQREHLARHVTLDEGMEGM